MPHRHHINPPLSIYKKIALSFIVLTFLLIVIIFYFTLSYAYITIYPKTQDINTDFNFIIVEDQNAVKATEGIFSGKLVDQTFENEKVFPATGSKLLTGDLVGRVKLVNNLSKVQTLIATTRLLTPDGTLFRIKNKVDIPAQGSLETDVYPDDPAKVSASAGTKFTIPGLSQNLQQFVYAQAVSDFKASGQEVKIITQEDLDKAASSYTDELAQQLITPDDIDKAKILNKEVISTEFSQKAGDQADEFKLKLKVKVSGVIFDESPVKDFAKKVMEGMVTSDEQLTSDTSDKLIYEIQKIDSANKVVQLKGSIKGTTVISENSQILDRDKLIRLSSDEIKAYLENFDNIESVDISFFPSWSKKMPFFQDHIIIKVNKE
jgi:hypothetical protein